MNPSKIAAEIKSLKIEIQTANAAVHKYHRDICKTNSVSANRKIAVRQFTLSKDLLLNLKAEFTEKTEQLRQFAIEETENVQRLWDDVDDLMIPTATNSHQKRKSTPTPQRRFVTPTINEVFIKKPKLNAVVYDDEAEFLNDDIFRNLVAETATLAPTVSTLKNIANDISPEAGKFVEKLDNIVQDDVLTLLEEDQTVQHKNEYNKSESIVAETSKLATTPDVTDSTLL